MAAAYQTVTETKTCDRNLLLFTVVFDVDTDMEIRFLVDEDEKYQLQGVRIEGRRKKTGKVYRLKSHVIQTVFQPQLGVNGPQSWQLKVQPLNQPLTIVKKPKKYVCKYPFLREGVLAKFTTVKGEATLQPLSMKFTVEGHFRSSKHAPPRAVRETIQCPDAFTDALYQVMTA